MGTRPNKNNKTHNNTNGNDDDYGYDVNGNLQHDHNKVIGDVIYTHFNKPSAISGDEGQNTEYSYDAAGSKVQELLISESGITRTDYIGNAVYRNDTILYIQTAEGRTVLDSGSVYPITEEFFVKDHLGNVRSRVNLISYSMNEYLATYEVASAYLEGLYFGQMDEIRDNRPGSTDSADAKSGNLNGGDPDRRIGSTLLVKVMAGDKISMSVNSYYSGYDSEEDDPKPAETMLTSVLGALTGGIGGYVGSESHEVKTAQSLFTETNFEDFDLLVQSLTDPTKPRAYLNYLFFNESMALVGTMSGAFQANGDGIWSQIGTTEALEIPENGFMAVYLSNASMNTGCLACSNVYFDQLSVQITKGNLLEENHYYPFGLPIKTMSSVANGALANRHKYQGNEYKQEQGLNWMDFQARQYDPQLGRFLSVDPLAGSGGQEIYSPYAAMGNAPEMMVDPNGEAFETAGGAKLKGIFNFGKDVPKPLAERTNDFGNPNVNRVGFWTGAASGDMIVMHGEEAQQFWTNLTGQNTSGSSTGEEGSKHKGNNLSINDIRKGSLTNNVVASTIVRDNGNGSYTVTGAANDGDNNIYVEGTGKVIGQTQNPWDFMETNDATGEFVGFRDVTFNINNLVDGSRLVANYAHQWRVEAMWLVSSLVSTPILAKLSTNNGYLDIKSDYDDPYTVASYGGKITTIRTLGNILFGINLRAIHDVNVDQMFSPPAQFYFTTMPVIGTYNQKQNHGNGYNAGSPFFGEHTYSGTSIYFGYFGKKP